MHERRHRAQAIAGRLFLTVFPSIMLPMFLAVADQTIVATALPAIAASLGGVERVSWVVVAYLVAGTVAAPVYGQLRDVYGGKRMMFVALGMFLAASLLCAAATSVEMLSLRPRAAGARRRRPDDAVAGADRRGHPAARARPLPGLSRLRHGHVSTFGPVIGGYLTQHFGWRSVFLVNLPLGGTRLPAHRAPAVRPARGEPWSFDGLGCPVRRLHRARAAGAGAGAADERDAASPHLPC